MIRLLQLLFLGHVHKWKIIKTGRYVDYAGFTVGGKDVSAQGTFYTQECEHCGKLKVFKE